MDKKGKVETIDDGELWIKRSGDYNDDMEREEISELVYSELRGVLERDQLETLINRLEREE